MNAGDRTVQVSGTQGRSSVGVWNEPDRKPKAYGLLQGSIRGRGKAAGAHPPLHSSTRSRRLVSNPQPASLDLTCFPWTCHVPDKQ